MRVEGQQQRGAFLDEADPGVTMAMNAALVAFGLPKPPFKVEVVLGQVLSLSSGEESWGKARHHTAHVLLHRVSTLLELLLQALKLYVPLGHCARRWRERRLDRPQRLDMGPYRLLDILHDRQPAVNVVG